MKAKNMTLRQHYAGLAMQALIGKTPLIYGYTSDNASDATEQIKAVCAGAFRYADVMIEIESIIDEQIKYSVWDICAAMINARAENYEGNKE